MRTVFTLLRDSYIECPDRTAIVLQAGEVDSPITYRQLLNASAGFSQAYEKAGIQAGEPVILILEHGDMLIEGFLGAILHGAIPSIMPFLTEKLDPERYRQSLAALIQVTQPAALVTYPGFVDEVARLASETDRFPAIILTTDVVPAEEVHWNRIRGAYRQPDDVVLLQHSSGTTGLQKGVALSHEAVIVQCESYSSVLAMGQDDVVVSWLPLYHDMGLIAGFILPLLMRSKLVLMSPFDWVRAPYRLMQAVTKYSGTLSWLPNFAYNFCAKKIRDRDLEGVDLTTWRAVINCSEPTRLESHNLFADRFKPYGFNPDALETCYAMAENVFAVTQSGLQDALRVDVVDREAMQVEKVAKPALESASGVHMLSAGKPIPGTKVRVVDDEGADLQDRHIGEIFLKGNCLLTGYFNRPEISSEVFENGWYRTGDLGYLADGELYVTGRRKELIIVGGKNIHPQDLEQLVSEVEGIHPGRVVAFGLFNEELGTEDIAIVAESPLTLPEDRASLSRAVRETIARGSDVTARYIEIVDREWLIKTSSGKIARGANQEKYLATLTKPSGK